MPTSIPFDFVFDYLPMSITTRKLFGMHYIYFGERIMLILRLNKNQPELNGVWVATITKHHESLQIIVPELGGFIMDGKEQHGNWLFIRDNEDDFEGAVIKVCELISRGDPRIGNVPK